jgi:5-hydroxyisourate hydrolase
MGRISTHVLDISRGRPAAGVAVTLEAQSPDGAWRAAGGGETDADGRLQLVRDAGGALPESIYRLTFDTGGYFGAQGVETFYPLAVVVFRVADPSQNYHVPLLVSPFGYSTYRGS